MPIKVEFEDENRMDIDIIGGTDTKRSLKKPGLLQKTIAGLGKLQEVLSSRGRIKGKPEISHEKQPKLPVSRKTSTKSVDEVMGDHQNGEVDIENGPETVSSLSTKKKGSDPKHRKKDTSKSKTPQKPMTKKKENASLKEEKGSKLTDFFKDKTTVTTDPAKREDQFNFTPSYIRDLAKRFPDSYWKELTDDDGNSNNEQDFKLVDSHINDRGAILGLHVSDDGELLATFSTLGTIKIWDTMTFDLLQELRDTHEPNFDEFYVGQFSQDSSLIVTGGKLKDKKRWSHEDDDNHILPCPIKIFDVVSGLVMAKLEGHEEEILCIKAVTFKQENYYLTTSQDGYIIRWHMGPDWKTLISKQRMDDGITCMAFTVSMVPNTGNKYFLGACDEHIRLFDFETCTLLQTFADIYSSYCDCGKFISYLNRDQEEDTNDDDGAYFVSRGVELLDSEGNTIASRPNTCTLHKLVFPKRKGGKFELREIRRYKHDEFVANSWLMKITSDGKHLLAPTLNGKVFFFDILSGKVLKILNDHDGLEVRDIKLNPCKKQLFTCSDDGNVKVYRQQHH